jgi:hypothetical protein
MRLSSFLVIIFKLFFKPGQLKGLEEPLKPLEGQLEDQMSKKD